MIALAAPGAPSPDHQRLNAMSLDLNAVRQNVDRITITQEQITRSVEQLTTGQEQMTREITKLQAVEQRILHKTPEPPPRPVPTSRKSVPRSLQAPTGLTPARKSLNQFGARAV